MTITVAELLTDKAKQSPSATLYTIAPASSVASAVALMIDNAISSVIVVEPVNNANSVNSESLAHDAKGQMLGLITLREILVALNQHGVATTLAACSSVMKQNPPTAKLDDTADYLRGLMTELHITHVPVLDEGKLVGILSFHDIARSAIKDAAFENKLLKQYIKHWPT